MTSKLPKEPNYNKLIQLMSKVHVDGIPNWTTQEQQDAYIELQSLMFYWFRKEIK